MALRALHDSMTQAAEKANALHRNEATDMTTHTVNREYRPGNRYFARPVTVRVNRLLPDGTTGEIEEITMSAAFASLVAIAGARLPIDTIKQVRAEYCCSLTLAKEAVEFCRDNAP